jgi:hypothetical protein
MRALAKATPPTNGLTRPIRFPAGRGPMAHGRPAARKPSPPSPPARLGERASRVPRILSAAKASGELAALLSALPLSDLSVGSAALCPAETGLRSGESGRALGLALAVLDRLGAESGKSSGGGAALRFRRAAQAHLLAGRVHLDKESSKSRPFRKSYEFFGGSTETTSAAIVELANPNTARSGNPRRLRWPKGHAHVRGDGPTTMRPAAK